MKALTLLLLFLAATVLPGCRAVYIERRRPVYVERPGYYYRPGYHVHRPTQVVVVEQPAYRHRHVTKIVYYNDRHGRYYWRDGRRIYVRRY
jgi:hypothetical protein